MMLQIIWGVALILAGIGVFYRIPEVMPQIEKINYFESIMFLVKICFYIIGTLLVFGGFNKVKKNYKKLKNK